jgi:MHS family proline/betaine transporter-like MFS transporter
MRGGRVNRRSQFFASTGTALEWYDLTLYVYLAPVISGLFFPSSDEVASLLATYGVFAVGYLMRPIGAIFFGWFGDTHGRKAALTTSVLLMSVPMGLIAVMPTYDTIGIAAPIILVVLRLVQGFSVGGEFSGTLVMLNETSMRTRKGFSASLAQATGGLGVVLASGVAALTHVIFTNQQMLDGAWRIPFGVGVCIGVLALFMRVHMQETRSFEIAKETGSLVKNPAKTAMTKHRKAVWSVFWLTAYLGIAYYLVATWLPGYLQTVIDATAEAALISTTLGSILYVVLNPVVGICSDRVGRKPVMITGAIGFVVLTYPLFMLVATTSFARILVGTVALMLLVITFTGGFSPTVTELFPTNARYSGLAIDYNIGNAIFAGTAPFIATLLVKVTGWDLSPSLYLIVPSLLILIVLFRMPEPSRLKWEGELEAGPGLGRPAAAPSAG